MIPEDQLIKLGEYLGLSPLEIAQVMSDYTAGNELNVGERAYKMFRCASRSGQPLTFDKVLAGLDKIDRSGDLVPILRSYIQSQSLNEDSSEADSFMHFVTWLCAYRPTLLPHLSRIAKDRVIQPEEQKVLFRRLSRMMVCVWKMVGRLLGLTDYEINEIDIEGSPDRKYELCYQLLLKWVECSQPSDVTYYRLMAVLEMTCLGGGAALDARDHLSDFVKHLAFARR